MRNFFYFKLALTNLRKNGKTYIPYLLTCICTIMMFYIIHSLSINKGIGDGSVAAMMGFGTGVIAIFSVIFLFYTNSFLIKRRKKELGLYNILGLEKKHIAKMLSLETIIIAFTSLVIGLAGGVLLSKLMYMALERLLNFSVRITFHISADSMIYTVELFAAIFLLTLLTNLLRIHLSNPIELLHGSQTGEKEPKTKWLLTIIGVITLGIGYGIAIIIQSPLQAFALFFVAVILVIIGTYALFTAGSIAVLKLLRKNKNYYYQTKHFTAVSGMLYRMKQNAVGLANICILSTMVLVTLSTTVSLYIGQQDTLIRRYPQEVQMSSHQLAKEEQGKLDTLIQQEAKKAGVTVQNKMQYDFINFTAIKTDGVYTIYAENGYDYTSTELSFLTLAEYNRLTNQSVTLGKDEVLLFSVIGDYGEDHIKIEETALQVKEELATIPIKQKEKHAAQQNYILVVKDETIPQQIFADTFQAAYGDYYEEEAMPLTRKIAFDLEGTDAAKIAFGLNMQTALDDICRVQVREMEKQGFYALYGGLLFLGIFLGALFLMATVLIIYYKQISEGFEDKQRFEIMQKVGMSKKEIKRSIHSQILLVFFLPLFTAILHIAFAFHMIVKLLAVLELSNILLFTVCTLCTILIFAVIYFIVFGLTAKAYYKIVN